MVKREAMMKIHTDRLLTLGMALTSDKRSMERRVRGVFARRKSAKSALALSLVLALTLGFAAFTTACQPGKVAGDVWTMLQPEQLSPEDEALRAAALKQRDDELAISGKFIAPRFTAREPKEKGSWRKRATVSEADALAAKSTFLDIANEIFDTGYSPDDVTASYYQDETGVRADLWRIDSKDQVLCGALNASSLRLISAQCKTIPLKAQHASIVDGKTLDEDKRMSLIDTSAAVTKVATALGVTADETNHSGYQRTLQAGYGWGVVDECGFYMDDGTFCYVQLYGDARLTPYTVAIYPDATCLTSNVYWPADRTGADQSVAFQSQIDFRVGEPAQDDMQLSRAVELFRAFLTAAGEDGDAADPIATFYVDHSGARENYWNLRAGSVRINIASKSGKMFSVIAMDGIGRSLQLPAASFEDEVKTRYVSETRRILESVLGKGAIIKAEFESISDDTNATVTCETADGARYVVFYFDRALGTIGYYRLIGSDPTIFCENWNANYQYINVKTGEIIITQ